MECTRRLSCVVLHNSYYTLDQHGSGRWSLGRLLSFTNRVVSVRRSVEINDTTLAPTHPLALPRQACFVEPGKEAQRVNGGRKGPEPRRWIGLEGRPMLAGQLVALGRRRRRSEWGALVGLESQPKGACYRHLQTPLAERGGWPPDL